MIFPFFYGGSLSIFQALSYGALGGSQMIVIAGVWLVLAFFDSIQLIAKIYVFICLYIHFNVLTGTP